MKRKLFTALILGLLAVCVFPVCTNAADVTIDDAWIAANGGIAEYDLTSGSHVSGDVITINASVPVTLTGIAPEGVAVNCTAGTDLVLGNAGISTYSLPGVCALSFIGSNNTLTISGSNGVLSGDGQPGIKVETGTALTIDGTGDLTAQCGEPLFLTADPLDLDSGAGIGGASGQGCGTIIINGGTIAASGLCLVSIEGGGAGIGGGYMGSGGSITINDGIVYAYGSTGAGIGGGQHGSAGTIVINGGEDIYSESEYGAGIGSGEFAGANAGTVEITGGQIIAMCYFDGAGIGGGYSSYLTSIEITGGEVGSSSENANGIGSGFDIISGGTITIGGYALVGCDTAFPAGAYDMGGASTIVIEDYAELFTVNGLFSPAPTTLHTYEPGVKLDTSAPNLTGVGAAYNFSSPTGWEIFGESGYFIERTSVNPRTGDTTQSHTWLIYLSLGLLVLAAGISIIKKRIKA